jgi:4-oxalocrotonate tautomerase
LVSQHIVDSINRQDDEGLTTQEPSMPLLTLDICSAPLTLDQRHQLQQGLTQLMASRLGKVAHLTVVQLRESSDRSLWSVGGRPLADDEWCASLQVAITEGTNTLPQHSEFLAAAHELLQAVLGCPPSAPLYILLNNVPAAHWGYGGRTQASRLVAAASSD